jgi:tripartite-type tricarboxylate transporter receptor subunit TctC
MQEIRARLAPQGVEVVTGTPQELAKLIRDDHARWGKIIAQAGIKGD